jgi:adenylate cyclase
MAASIRQYNKKIWIALIVLFSAGLGFALSNNDSFRSVEHSGIDLLFQIRPKPTEITETIVVMIDEKSYAPEFGYYDPLPRRYIARLIDTLAAKGAKTIALDIAFYDKLDVLDPKGDTLLVQSMKRAGNVIAVSIWYPQEDGTIKNQFPHPFFMSALKGVGYANLQIYGSGVLSSVRAVRPIQKMGDGTTVLSFSSLAYCEIMDIKKEKFIEEVESRAWDVVPPIPMDAQGNMIINYVGPPATWVKQPDGEWTQNNEGTIYTYRSSKITGAESSQWPEDFLKDKLVLVGNGSEFAVDRFITPYYESYLNNWMYGAEVHANAFLTMLNKKFLQRTSPVTTFGLMLVFCLLMVLATIRFGFVGEAFVAVILLLSTWALGFHLFAAEKLWLPVWSMTISVLFAYFSTSIYQAFTEERNKKQIKSMFSRYAPPAYVDELVKDPTKLELGGEEKEISILFSDIEGFTTISESLSPRKLIEMLNDYLNTMTHLIFNQGGSLDKYIGDAIVAVFGAPLPQNEHALHACYAALDMQKALIEFRQRTTTMGLPVVRSRVGINTGHVVFGNIGSDIRYDYTGIGDHMNLASRLEGANKEYGTYIMISEFTYDQVRERVIARDLDLIVVKGKSKPVKVYELLGRANEPLPEDLRKTVEYYQEGIALYRGRKWEEAIKKFEQALAYSHTDEPSKLYIQRCKHMIANPPGQEWDGSFHMTSK